MRISYTPEQDELRRELRSYFSQLVTPERREALMATGGEYGTGDVYRETVAQMGRDGLPVDVSGVASCAPTSPSWSRPSAGKR